MEVRKKLHNWVNEGFHPALCYPCIGGFCPLKGGSCGGDVKLLTITAQCASGVRGVRSGYNIWEESLIRGSSEFWAPGPLALQHIFNAAGMLPPYTLADWYPLEKQEWWAAEHAGALAELRRNGPLTEPDPARRRKLRTRALAELKPPRPWFLLKELIEPGDVVFPVGDHGPTRTSTCCVQEVV